MIKTKKTRQKLETFKKVSARKVLGKMKARKARKRIEGT